MTGMHPLSGYRVAPEMIKDAMSTDKPFHLLTPAEKTALRIAQNRAISEKAAGSKPQQKPPAHSTSEGIRATPDEHAKLGGVIRKVQR
jgi:hypothetical protein